MRIRVGVPATLVAWASCTPDFGAPRPPGITSGPRILAPASPDVTLAQILEVSTDVPTRLTVVLEGADTRREIAFPDEVTEHTVPLLGLVEQTEYTAIVSVESADGVRVTAEPLTVPAGVAFAPVPDRRLLVRDPARMEPGYTLYPAKYFSIGGNALLEAVDDRGRLVWQYRPSLPEDVNGSAITAVQFHPGDGTVSALVNGTTVRRFDFTNTTATTWASESDAIAGAIPVGEVGSFHDEAAFEPDGSFWTLYKRDAAVVGYPTDPSDPSVTGPAVLDADVVVHVAADGTLLGSWPLTDYLDPHRIGFDATDQNSAGKYFWSNANAVVPLGDDLQTFLVSSGNQDAVVKIHGDTNQAVWILANHDGWALDYVPLLLEPVGDAFEWPSHQHAPAYDDAGRLLLFDNGNWEHMNPYQGPQPALDTGVSRLVRYEVDEEEWTVTQSFTFVADEDIDPLFSNNFGNADPMPVTGNVLGTFAGLERERNIGNIDAGLGMRSIRIIEVDPEDGSVVWDLGLNGPFAEVPLGWQGDRAIRVASLYPADVTVTLIDYGP